MAGRGRPPANSQTPEQAAAAKAEREKAKAEKFVEMANKRVSAALEKIALISNLSNRSSYSYTPDQVNAIGNALVGEVNKALAPFTFTTKATGQGFDIGAAVQKIAPPAETPAETPAE